jgi:hypothetical protein
MIIRGYSDQLTHLVVRPMNFVVLFKKVVAEFVSTISVWAKIRLAPEGHLGNLQGCRCKATRLQGCDRGSIGNRSLRR